MDLEIIEIFNKYKPNNPIKVLDIVEVRVGDNKKGFKDVKALKCTIKTFLYILGRALEKCDKKEYTLLLKWLNNRRNKGPKLRIQTSEARYIFY